MIRFSTVARSDLGSIASTIAADNGPAVATRVTGRITASITHLDAFPEMGRIGRQPNTREIVVPGLPYIVVYQLRPDAVYVARVIHGAMRWPPTPSP